MIQLRVKLKVFLCKYYVITCFHLCFFLNRHTDDDDSDGWRHFASYTLPGVILLLLGCRWAIGLILEWTELIPDTEDIEADKSVSLFLDTSPPSLSRQNSKACTGHFLKIYFPY